MLCPAKQFQLVAKAKASVEVVTLYMHDLRLSEMNMKQLNPGDEKLLLSTRQVHFLSHLLGNGRQSR